MVLHNFSRSLEHLDLHFPLCPETVAVEVPHEVLKLVQLCPYIYLIKLIKLIRMIS
jgi:hypothetical protein